MPVDNSFTQLQKDNAEVISFGDVKQHALVDASSEKVYKVMPNGNAFSIIVKPSNGRLIYSEDLDKTVNSFAVSLDWGNPLNGNTESKTVDKKDFQLPYELIVWPNDLQEINF